MAKHSFYIDDLEIIAIYNVWGTYGKGSFSEPPTNPEVEIEAFVLPETTAAILGVDQELDYNRIASYVDIEELRTELLDNYEPEEPDYEDTIEEYLDFEDPYKF